MTLGGTTGRGDLESPEAPSGEKTGPVVTTEEKERSSTEGATRGRILGHSPFSRVSWREGLVSREVSSRRLSYWTNEWFSSSLVIDVKGGQGHGLEGLPRSPVNSKADCRVAMLFSGGTSGSDTSFF